MEQLMTELEYRSITELSTERNGETSTAATKNSIERSDFYEDNKSERYEFNKKNPLYLHSFFPAFAILIRYFWFDLFFVHKLVVFLGHTLCLTYSTFFFF